MALIWKRIPCKAVQLQLAATLNTGQAFRWRKTSDNEWTGVLGHKIWTLSQAENELLYTVRSCGETKPQEKVRKGSKRRKVSEHGDEDDAESVLKDYFQLKINLEEKYEEWSKADPNFSNVAKNYTGIRMLRQNPVETLFSFICSSNNNITRITKMIDKMCELYGDYIGEIDDVKYYSFPSIERLADDEVEKQLRGSGFGYRAKFINQAARHILEKDGAQWLNGLRNEDYETALKQLVAIPGIGTKVADCICLMALDKLQAVPVDTHIWQITCRSYLPHLSKQKSVTASGHKEIGNHFRSLFGNFAGWATTVLFVADLKKR